MSKYLTTKSFFLIFSIFILVFVNTQISWAVRNPDDEHANRPQPQLQNKKNSARTIVAPATANISNTSKVINKEKRAKHASDPIIRDLRDLTKLKTVLSGKPKTQEEIGVALINLLKISPQWLGEVPVKNLRLDYVKIVSSVDGRAQDAYVRFVQQHRGSDIEDSFVAFTLKIFPEWTMISSAQAQLYPKLKFRQGAHRARALTDEIVDRESLKSLHLEGKRVSKKHDQRRVRFIDGQWRVVREIKYEESDYQAVIDEASEESWIEDMRMYGTIQGKVEGRGILFDPQATGTNLNILKLKDLKLSMTSGATAYSDVLGSFNFSSEATTTNVSAALVGRWAKVISKKNDDLTFGAAAIPGTELDITFNSTGASESSIAQVNGYYHTTFIHDWLQARLAPNPLPALDVSFPVNVNANNTCNAFYDGSSINFYSTGGGCINSAYDTVVYHEYGHFIDHRIGGITDGGLSEGWGDVVASYATGQPVIGEGFFGSGTNIRRADNNYQYPANGNAEVHILGQAWAGFAWHLRENLIASLGEVVGIATAENLIIPTLYANSQDIPTAVYDVLIRDDNDADLGNSTPHYMEIANAAARHSIPLPENDVTSPAPVIDLHVASQDELDIYLSWTASGDDGRVGTASSYDIRYSLTPIQTENDFAAATPISNTIVPLPSGQVEWMSFTHPALNTTYYFAMKVLDNMQNTSTLSNVVATMVQANVVAFEDFENGTQGWSSDGLWHVTGARSNSPVKSFAYNNGVDYDTGARNFGSLISPSFAIPNNAARVVISFKEWVNVEKSGSFDKRSIAISSNNGVSWQVHPLSNYSVVQQQWQNYSMAFSGYAGKNVRFRFLFDSVDQSNNSMEGWYVDDVGVYYTRPPVFETISNQTIDAGQTLTFSVLATDPDGQSLTYSALGLPLGATFKNQVFSWSPTLSQVGIYGVKFIVSNGNLSDQKVVLITVENPNRPDLIVQEIVLTSPTVPAGGQLLMSDKVKNIGLFSAGVSSLRITLSSDATYGGTDDIYLINANIAALPAGGEVDNLRVIPILGTIPQGQYYVCAKIDSNIRIPESNEDNNTRCSATTVAITSAALPDLVITAMDGPSEYIQGTRVPLNATIKNQGSGIASNFQIAYFVSTDPIITPLSDQLVSVQYISTLASGATFNSSMLSDRLNLPPGTYYWGAYVDDNGSQPESNEANNSFVGNAVTVFGLTAPVLNSAIPGYEAVTLNWSAVPSATSYMIKYGTVSGNFSGSIYLGNITSFTVLNLTAGQPYYFVVFAKNAQGYSASSNEKSATPLGLPDVVMSNLSGPTSAIQGKTVTLNDQVSNTGLSSTGGFEVAYYLSTDQTISTSDILVATRLISGLPQNSHDYASVDVGISESLAPGNYYWGAIADYKQAQSEVDEKNNIILGNSVAIQIPVPATPVLNSGTPGVGEIALSWNSVSTATGYNVMYGTKSGVYTTLMNAGNVTSFIIPNLLNGVTYYVAIAAINLTGSSSVSNEISAVPQNLVEVAKIAIDNYFQDLLGDQDTTLSKAALDAAIAAVLNPADITIVTDYYDSAALATAKTAVDNLFVAIVAGENPNSTKLILTAVMPEIMNPADKTAANNYYDSVALATAKTVVDNYVQAIIDGQNTTALKAILDAVVDEIMNPNVKTDARDYYEAALIKTIKPILNSIVPGNADVTLSWDNVASATGYIINYGTTTGDYSSSIEAGNVNGYAVSGLTNGTMYYFVVVAKNSVGSSRISNEKSATPNQPVPDLVINEVSISSNGKVGSPSVITDTVTNQGTAAASGFYIAYYLSTDSVITLDDKLLNYRYVPTLAAGASSTKNTTVNIPSMAPGTYYIGAIADIFNNLGEADENNNIVTGNMITIIMSGADLVMTTVNGLTSGKVGSPITITDTVTNQGTDNASGFYVGYYLSTDAVITTSDNFLYSRYVPSLVAGTSDTRSLTVVIPNLAPGDYFLGAIADAFNSQGESNENNNVIAGNVITVTALNMDLITSALSAPASGKIGSAVTITDTVTNQGTENASAFYMGYYLSTDPIITTSDRLVYYRYVPSLAAGASNTGSVTYNIPNLDPGTYYWGAIADAFNSQSEVNEGNNAKVGNIIEVASSTVDLVMSALNGPATVRIGSLVTLTDTVTNQGVGSVGGFYVAYYLSTDAVITTGDKFLYYRYVPSLAQGASDTGSVTYNASKLAPGTYYWGAIADAFGSQAESNEMNNAIASNAVNISL
jgi:subtilase family serine protease